MTPLYREVLEFNSSDDERDQLSRKVWEGTPWMIDVYVGRIGEDRERSMLHWCYKTYGDCAHPFGKEPTPGRWRQGNATVFGWTWFGFSTEAEMTAALAAWPVPGAPTEGVGEAPHPEGGQT